MDHLEGAPLNTYQGLDHSIIRLQVLHVQNHLETHMLG